MKYLLIVLLAVSSFSYAGEKKEITEPTIEVSVKDISILMQLAEDQKQIIEELQEKLRESNLDINILWDKCTF